MRIRNMAKQLNDNFTETEISETKKNQTVSEIIKDIESKKPDKLINQDDDLTKNDLKKNKLNSDFKDLLKNVDIDEFYTKFDKKQKKFNKFINSIVPEKGFNYMSDLIIMPKTKEGYRYLLVILDLATNEMDIEPMKTKTAIDTLNAFKAILKRKILKLPEMSFQTDGGSEFKAQFNKFLEDNAIYHKVSYPANHKQQAPIEGLNNIITRILMNYLNKKSLELDKDYMNWNDILPLVRTELNKYRKIDLDKLKKYQDKHFYNDYEVKKKFGEPTFKIGDMVHYRLFQPTDIRGKPINDSTFRNGDRRLSINTKKIIKILYYPDFPHYRFVLHYMPHVSFSAYDLKPSKNKEETFLINKIIDREVRKGKTYYKVFWKGYLKKDSTWEPADRLIKDNLGDYIASFEKEQREKKKKN